MAGGPSYAPLGTDAAPIAAGELSMTSSTAAAACPVTRSKPGGQPTEGAHHCADLHADPRAVRLDGHGRTSGSGRARPSDDLGGRLATGGGAGGGPGHVGTAQLCRHAAHRPERAAEHQHEYGQRHGHLRGRRPTIERGSGAPRPPTADRVRAGAQNDTRSAFSTRSPSNVSTVWLVTTLYSTPAKPQAATVPTAYSAVVIPASEHRCASRSTRSSTRMTSPFLTAENQRPVAVLHCLDPAELP